MASFQVTPPEQFNFCRLDEWPKRVRREARRDMPQVDSGGAGKGRCGWCGRTSCSSRQQCPARNATCFKCSKKGHFESVCRTTTKPGEVLAISTFKRDYFVGMIRQQKLGSKTWCSSLFCANRI